MKITLFFTLLMMSTFSFAGWKIRNSVVDERKDGTYELREYNADLVPVLELDEGSMLVSCSLNGKKCGPGEKLFLNGKLPEKFGERILNFSFRENKNTTKVKLHLLPASFPYFKMAGTSVINKPLITAVYQLPIQLNSSEEQGCHLLILSPKGELLFQRKINEQCSDFRPHDINGERYYSYQIVDQTEISVGFFGPRVILDPAMKPVKTVAYGYDGHEFILYGLDHWLGMEVELGRMISGLPYLDKRIRERKDGKILFDWGASDYIKQFGSEAMATSYLASFQGEVVGELLHLNAIQTIGDKGLLISLGMNGVAYLNKETKKIDWVLGGFNDQFSLRKEEHPVFLHNPWFDPATSRLVLFSNWGFGLAKYSRVLAYDLDLKEKRVKKFTELRAKDELVMIQGSLQLTEGVLTLSFGTKEKAKNDIVEMKGAEETWALSFGKGRHVYRAYRAPWP